MPKESQHTLSLVPPYLSKRMTGDIAEHADRETEPEVVLNVDTDKYVLQGISSMLKAREFYTEILVWLEMYGRHALQGKTLHVRLCDFNASSALYLSKLFELWVSLDEGNKIVWHHRPDDDWEEESGQIFKEILAHQFELFSDPTMPYRRRNEKGELIN